MLGQKMASPHFYMMTISTVEFTLLGGSLTADTAILVSHILCS